MKTYKNILVNALVNLGDVVLTTSAIALLKKPDTLGINYMRFVIKMEFFIRLIFHLQMFMM